MNQRNNIRKNFLSVLIGTLLVMCLFGCGKDTVDYIDANTVLSEVSEYISSQEEVVLEQKENTVIYIYVCGEVEVPGVYEMPEGSRICDVFLAAGGLTEQAAKDYWNQAKIVVDGEMIYVPTLEEAKERSIQSLEAEVQSDGKININAASKEQLMTIPGVGEAKAIAIIAYRQEHGAFSKIEDVMNVEGIKDGVFAKMKEYIVVN